MSQEQTETRKPAPFSAALRALSVKLAKRYPDRQVQRFVMPSRIRECREIFIREIDSKDEIRAAAMADATMSREERASMKLSNDAEKRESIRISICAIGEAAADGSVVYREVNENEAIPFVDCSTWTTKAWAALHTWFGTVNGIPFSDLAEGIAGAQIVGALSPPMTEPKIDESPDRSST